VLYVVLRDGFELLGELVRVPALVFKIRLQLLILLQQLKVSGLRLSCGFLA
jgi:hypothetical protein